MVRHEIPVSSEPELTLGVKSRRSIERGSAYLFAITPISKVRYHKNDGKEEREVTRNTHTASEVKNLFWEGIQNVVYCSDGTEAPSASVLVILYQ